MSNGKGPEPSTVKRLAYEKDTMNQSDERFENLESNILS